ncbi:MAG: hypothetical protein ACT4O3_01145 [Elusimicrobiota bacterium]|jgi:hypothetical protein
MDHQGPHDKGKRPSRKTPRLSKKKLDRFLASICEAAGMTGKKPSPKNAGKAKAGLVCRGPCRQAEWRSHLDIADGILCVSASWSQNKRAEKHKDITVSLTYLDDEGKPDYADMVLCDSEIRWLMEALWHAPIWSD